MSLTGFLKSRSNPIREFFQSRFPHTKEFLANERKRMQEADVIRPVEIFEISKLMMECEGEDVRFSLAPKPSGRIDIKVDKRFDPAVISRVSYPYSTIGMALDYRLRYYFEITPFEELVANEGAKCIGYIPWLRAFKRSLTKTLREFNPVRRRLDKQKENRLNQHCVTLAWLETIFRCSALDIYELLLSADRLSDILERVECPWLDDMRSLSWAFHDCFKNLLPCSHVLNPTFEGSKDIGGADGDLIVDGTLLDIKSTINSEIQKQWIYQLLGYVLLDYSNQYKIRSIGLYMSRQRLLFKWDLHDTLQKLSSDTTTNLEDLRREFRKIILTMRDKFVNRESKQSDPIY